MKLFFIAFISCLLLFSCNNAQERPEENARLFVHAIGKKDLSEARKYATLESYANLAMAEFALKNLGLDKGYLFDTSQVAVGTATITGDSAKVPVSIGGQSFNYHMLKGLTGWKVSVTKDDLRNMGFEKIGSLQQIIAGKKDSLVNVIKVNADSISKKATDAIGRLDSLKNIKLDSLKNIKVRF